MHGIYNQQYTCQLDCTNLFIARDLLSATLAGSFDLEVKVKAARVDPVPDSGEHHYIAFDEY